VAALIGMVDRLVNSEANAKRIRHVEECFGSSGQPLAVPGRVLVGEGVLIKMCRKKPKARQFFLFNDILVYGNIILMKRKYNKQHLIPLDAVQLEDLRDDADLRNGWLIKTPTKSFAVYAATSTEKREWMVHIQRCVDDLLAKSGKLPPKQGSSAPVWVPDNEAPMCMHCKRVQFTILNRRHHCRKCGLVVCDKCSSNRYLLPNQNRKPLRVCDGCFKSLASTAPSSHGGASFAPKGPQAVNHDTSGDDDSDEEDDKDGPQSADVPTFYGDVGTKN